MDSLRRSTPFLSLPEDGEIANLRLDDIRAECGSDAQTLLGRKLANMLDLTGLDAIPAEICTELVEEQYAVSLSHIYAHPIWDDLRAGTNELALYSYLIETRHYLHAALWRMCPSLRGLDACHPLRELLSYHVIEEADHARFFEKALAAIGVASAALKRLRPHPATIEWIHLMRAMEQKDPLNAALCSGLMEESGSDRQLVADWHTNLYESGQLSKEASDSIFDHVREDMSLGHGQNWRKALEIEGSVSGARLARCLNDVASVTEMIFRWLGAVRSGMPGRAIVHLRDHDQTKEQAQDPLDRIFGEERIWAANVYDEMMRSRLPNGAADALAVAFCGAQQGAKRKTEFDRCVSNLQKIASTKPVAKVTTKSVDDCITGWMTAIDGHVLWRDMAIGGEAALTQGWLLENMHYLAASTSHTSCAIASCDDPAVREHLSFHLREETDHAEILAAPLRQAQSFAPPEQCRPLPTTLSFIGWLADLGTRDWAAYVLALIFLQRTLTPGDRRHARFYNRVKKSSPQSARFLAAMKKHDRIDTSKEHPRQMSDLLKLIVDRGHVTPLTIKRVALVAQMSWSFLDGIWDHYRWGSVALTQRTGWAG